MQSRRDWWRVQDVACKRSVIVQVFHFEKIGVRVNDSFHRFPSVLTAIQEGIDRNLHTGVQIYVSFAGEPLLNAGFGVASGDRVFTANTISLWRSAGKPVTAAAIMRLIQESRLTLDTNLATVIPETGAGVLGGITVKQLLTHTSGKPLLDTGWPQASWPQILQTICSADRLTGDSAYQPQSTWFLLGEIMRRLDSRGRSYQQILTDDVLQPLGMDDVWCGIPEETISTVSDRLPDYWTREKGQLSPSPYSKSPWLNAPSPGGNLRGPVSRLGRFYEMLMNGGRLSTGDTFLSDVSVKAMTSRQRAGQFDQTLQHVVDFGLGVIVDSNCHGSETVPYGFGRYCSPETFGHGGSQCAMGFCDPIRKLVVCWAANGFCGEGQHQRRNRAINEAVYADLGF